jgi:hypothetical protein
VSPMVRSEPPFIGRRGRARGWPGRARDMAMARFSVISSGRDGQGGVGCVCRCCGDVGGAPALQDDEGIDREQWHLRTWSGRLSSLLLVGTRRIEQGMGGEMHEATQAHTWEGDGLAERAGIHCCK